MLTSSPRMGRYGREFSRMPGEPMLNGIYCIEISDWGYRRNEKTTLAPVLQLLKGMDGMPYRYASYSTREELRFQLHEWQRHSKWFPYLYLGAHGEGTRIFCKRL